MRIKFNSMHLKEFVTINQSLIIGTHTEARGILNFLPNSLGLSPPINLIFKGVEYREAVLLLRRTSPSTLDSLPFFPGSRRVIVYWHRQLNSHILSENWMKVFLLSFIELSGEVYFWAKNIKISESSAPCSKMEREIIIL